MKQGDFIKIEYIGRVSATGEIFDLTSEQTAKKEGFFNPKQRYGPVLVIIGAGMIVPGVEKELETMKPGDEKEFIVKPDEGFGKRDPRLIKIISMAQFRRAEKPFNPVPGIFVTVNGMRGRVQSVSGGRVRVDFNHPLAGKELRYKVKVVETIDRPLDRARAIFEYYGIAISGEPKLETKKLRVETEKEIPEPVRKLLTETIKKWIKEIETVDFSPAGKSQKPVASSKVST